MFRSCILFVVTALLFASCGYTRSEAVSIQGESAAQNTDAQVDPATGQPVTAQNGPPPTALAPAVEIPSKGAAEEVAASLDFGDGQPIEITFGEIDEVVQPSLASAQYRVLGDVAPTFDTQILNLLIFSRTMDAELAEQGVEVSETDRTDAKEMLVTEVSGLLSQQAGDPEGDRTDVAEKLFEEVPHLSLILEARAKQNALVSHFESTATPGEVPCVSHILVAEEQQAADILAELEAGADFNQLVQERSTDETSKANDGVLGCAAPDDFVDPAFVDAVKAAELNKATGPVQTQLGWHVLLVTEFVVEDIEPAALAERQFQQSVDGRVTDSTIEINAKIGRWDNETAQLVPAGS